MQLCVCTVNAGCLLACWQADIYRDDVTVLIIDKLCVLSILRASVRTCILVCVRACVHTCWCLGEWMSGSDCLYLFVTLNRSAGLSRRRFA